MQTWNGGKVMILSLWITNGCNMKCTYCYETPNSEIQMMKAENIEHILALSERAISRKESETIMVHFFGGEPLLNVDYIYSFINKVSTHPLFSRFHFSITTNGSLLDSSICKLFEKYKFECSLSLDGLPEIHRKNRIMKNGKDSWSVIDNKLKLLQKYNLNIVARITYNSSTVSELINSIYFLIDKGFNYIKAVPDYFDPNWSLETVKILKQEIYEIQEITKAHPEIRIPIENTDLLRGYIGCGGGNTILIILPNGDIYPCNYAVDFPSFKLGNLCDLDNFHFTDNCSDHSCRISCKGCKYFSACKSGRCIYLNYKLNGNMYTPGGFFCSYQKIMFESVGL